MPIKRGQPSKFETIDLEQLEFVVREKGFDDKSVCKLFKINPATLTNYKKSHPQFFATLKDWKKEADARVERSLYERALGYSVDEVVFEKNKPGGLSIGVKYGEVDSIKHTETYKVKVTTKAVLPDVTAQIFWLKNRQPKQWREKIEHDLPEEIGATLKGILHGLAKSETDRRGVQALAN